MVNTLFNKLLGKNEKYASYFYIKRKQRNFLANPIVIRRR